MQVLDTSVIYKWYVEENGSRQALKILSNFIDGKTEISVPDLVLYELANALKSNPQNIEKDIEDVIDNFINLNLNIVVATSGLLKNAVKVSYKYDVTIYDAIYIALAEDLNFEFITADKKLFDKIKSLPFVKLL
ncbi:MAG: type II toxin-antitoxin system VapC family toxin [Elusimicrobiota bacterium]